MSSNHDPNQLSTALSNIALSYETEIFQEEYLYAKGLLDDAQCFEKAEMTRLREIFHVLTTENSLLAPSDQQDTESITTAVAVILSENPFRSLSSPCAFFYDDLAPRLTNFIKTLPVEGMEGAVYHPLSPVYVPSFLGQGIHNTSVAIELADDSVPCNHNTHDAKTAPGGSRLWVAKDVETGKKWIL
ncbi:hypothetical protein HDK77DRAFT_485474 [Phyllosticta capitalensis]